MVKDNTVAKNCFSYYLKVPVTAIAEPHEWKAQPLGFKWCVTIQGAPLYIYMHIVYRQCKVLHLI